MDKSGRSPSQNFYRGIIDCMDEDEDIAFVCIVDCPDCDKTILTDPDYISVFLGFGDIWGITICGYCERPVSCSIPKDLAIEFAELGVKMFSWETGQQIDVAGVQKLQ